MNYHFALSLLALGAVFVATSGNRGEDRPLLMPRLIPLLLQNFTVHEMFDLFHNRTALGETILAMNRTQPVDPLVLAFAYGTPGIKRRVKRSSDDSFAPDSADYSETKPLKRVKRPDDESVDGSFAPDASDYIETKPLKRVKRGFEINRALGLFGNDASDKAMPDSVRYEKLKATNLSAIMAMEENKGLAIGNLKGELPPEVEALLPHDMLMKRNGGHYLGEILFRNLSDAHLVQQPMVTAVPLNTTDFVDLVRNHSGNGTFLGTYMGNLKNGIPLTLRGIIPDHVFAAALATTTTTTQAPATEDEKFWADTKK